MSDLENEMLGEQESEELENTAEATSEAVEEAAPARKAAVHMTASAAALNAEGEVDIRRRKPREVKQIKESKISYERKKQLYGYGFVAIWIIGVLGQKPAAGKRE